MTKWRYYNHAMTPSQAPHLPVDISAVEDGSVFKADPNGKKALFARWTEGWDLPCQTNWWYLICKPPFSLENLSKSSRKNIKNALKKCEVKKIKPLEYKEDIWRIYMSSVSHYENFKSSYTEANYIERLKLQNVDWWAAFSKEDGRMIGYKSVNTYDTYVHFTSAKYDVGYLKMRASDALAYTCLSYYLSKDNVQYVSEGARSISHITNVQNYYIEHFKFYKAYCKLKLRFRPSVAPLIKMIYPFRRFFIIFDKIHTIHLLNSVLKMEEICRSDANIEVSECQG